MRQFNNGSEDNIYFGPTLEIWEGYAADPDIRFSASSGGALSALSLYCLEKENIQFVLHTGMNPDVPWENNTITSRNRVQLLARTGSRYSPSSPCDSIRLIEENDERCVFIGKPCDASAMMSIREEYPQVLENVALMLTFFCAGVPSTLGTLELIRKMSANEQEISNVRYRGKGWPGDFQLDFKDNRDQKGMTYFDSWHQLQKFRSLRCHLCPDGLGQIADISCGDAWYKYSKESKSLGESLILVRTEKGREFLHRAMEAGYLIAKKSNASNVINSQGLIGRRKELFGRLVARCIFFLPIPNFAGFELYKSWKSLSMLKKISNVLGSIRRILLKGLWHKNRSGAVIKNLSR
ncbi:MAG: Coenzyme F420 hydrogenase/dehydrogenase, beta subunit C-terminal domain [Candidatus Zhuqueibacterota bacterium]